MKFLMNTVLLVVAVVAVIIAIGAAWFGAASAAYRFKLGWVEVPVHYRLSFGVEVGGIRYTGSTVIQFIYREIPYWQMLTVPTSAALYKGQAGCVKLPNEKMVCLMPGAKTMVFGKPFYVVGLPNDLLSVNGSPTGPKEKSRPIGVSNAATVFGSSDIPINLLPPMIVLDDPARPSSAHLFDPKHPEQTLGAQSRFLGAQIAVTDDPVSQGIETILPWLHPGRSQRFSNPGDPFEQENHGNPLLTADFY
jgi:hypothetical protein